MTRSMTISALEKKTFDEKKTSNEKKSTGVVTRSMAKSSFEKKMLAETKGVVTRSMSRAAFENRKIDKAVVKDNRKSVNISTIENFVLSDDMDYDDTCVLLVPGVGEVNKKLLNKEGIETVSDMIDVFFELEDDGEIAGEGQGIDGASKEFGAWLKSIGVDSHRDTITSCISAKWYLLVRYHHHITMKMEQEFENQEEEVEYKMVPKEDVKQSWLAFRMGRAIFAAGVLSCLFMV